MCASFLIEGLRNSLPQKEQMLLPRKHHRAGYETLAYRYNVLIAITIC
jgi:hypothetical protein